MLAKMIDKIVSLKETKTFEIGGQTYGTATSPGSRPTSTAPRPSASAASIVCKLIRTSEKVGTTIMVQAKSYKSVEVMTTYLSDFSRNILYRAEADAPGIYTGFRSREVALIELRSCSSPTRARPTCSTCCGRMTDEKSVSTNDNGVTQTVEARQGVALNALVEVKPPRPAAALPHFPRGGAARERVPAARGTPRRASAFSRPTAGSGSSRPRRISPTTSNTNLADLIEAGKVVIMQ